MEEKDAANVTADGVEKVDAKCFVEPSGKVNCSEIIYEDERSWKKSRNQIDLLIQVLKSKIIDLKDIKRHLKSNKPNHFKDDDENDSSEESESASNESSASILKTDYFDTFNVTKKPAAAQNSKHNGAIQSTTEANEFTIESPSSTMKYAFISSVSSTTTTTPTTSRTTKSPTPSFSKPGHRVKANSTVHVQHRNHSHGARGHNGSPRKTTGGHENTTLPGHRSHDHLRKNWTRHSKHSTTTKIPLLQTITTTISTTLATAATTTEDSLFIDPQNTTAKIDSIIELISNINVDELVTVTRTPSVQTSTVSIDSEKTSEVSFTQIEDDLKKNSTENRGYFLFFHLMDDKVVF